jgi:hypothetical protein
MKTLIVATLALFTTFSNATGKQFKINDSDTIGVNYTYWWPSGGPFIGQCGDAYSLVFTGTITKLNKPQKTNAVTNNVYQEGVIKMNTMMVKNPPTEGYKELPGKNYNGEHYFKSNCFHDSGLKEGDKVIVFVYSYEGEYSIPANSILKVENFDAPIIRSIDKYIKSGQNPLTINEDMAIWNKYGLDYALKQIVDCKLSSKD